MPRGEHEATRVVGNELLYDPLDRSSTGSSAADFFRLFKVPVIVGAALSLLLSPLIGLAALVATAAYVQWKRRNAAKPGLVSLRVEGHAVVVEQREMLTRFLFDDLVDVALDTKVIQRVLEGSPLVPATMFIESRVGPGVDTARIVLVSRNGGRTRELPLSEDYLAHIDASESLGKIRTFLRRHGWVPADEREEREEAPPSALSV